MVRTCVPVVTAVLVEAETLRGADIPVCCIAAHRNTAVLARRIIGRRNISVKPITGRLDGDLVEDQELEKKVEEQCVGERGPHSSTIKANPQGIHDHVEYYP